MAISLYETRLQGIMDVAFIKPNTQSLITCRRNSYRNWPFLMAREMLHEGNRIVSSLDAIDKFFKGMRRALLVKGKPSVEIGF